MPSLTPPPSSLPLGSTVWAYLRDSGGPHQDRSIEQQRGEILEYCVKHGLQLAHNPFEDVHKSGGSTVGRAQFDEMIALSASPAFRPVGLLIWNFARFARDVTDSEFYKGLLRKRKVVIHSLTDDIPEGPFAPVIETVIHVADEHKRHEAALGAWRGLRGIVRQGAMPGTPPRGFRREPITVISEQGIAHTVHRWVPDPDTAPLVRLAFKMRAEGKSLAEINRQTRLYGSLNSYKTFWSNRLYIGVLKFGDLVIENYAPPIVDLPLWDAVQKLTAERAEKKASTRHPRREHSSYLLSGLVHCSLCGAPLAGNTRVASENNHHRSYRCTRATRRRDCAARPIPADVLERSVLETLQGYILRTDVLSAAQQVQTEELAGQESTLRERRAVLDRDLAKLQRQISNLTAAIAESGHSRSILDQLADREKARDELQRDLAALNNPQPTPAPISAEALAARTNDLVEILKNAPLEQVQLILRGFIPRIDVQKEGREISGTIYYYIPPPPFPVPPEGGDLEKYAYTPSLRGGTSYRHTFQHPIVPSGLTWQRKKRPG